MTKLYSYVLRFDCGAAPNPFWGICTLAICKPVIRRTAECCDWVIGTGSANALINGKACDLSNYVVYAMKITEIKGLECYDQLCQQYLPNKIPDCSSSDWRKRMGDCLYYDFASQSGPKQRKGVHNAGNITQDLSGKNVLLSKHFYYFGEKAQKLPGSLNEIIKKGPGHKIIERCDLIKGFENWIEQFEKNEIVADPQMRCEYDGMLSGGQVINCAKCLKDDKDETVEIVS